MPPAPQIPVTAPARGATSPRAQRAVPGADHGRSRTLRRDLRSAMIDGTAFSVMVGIGENYLAAFILALHGTAEIASGLIASVPLLAGAVLQLASPRLVRLLGSHRSAVVLSSILQALSFLPLASAALFGYAPVAAVFAAAALYWAGGLSAGAAWSNWAPNLVPQRLRARYFARRTRLIHAGVLAGLIAGGALLHLTDHTSHALHAFTLMFVVACAARLVSAYFLSRQSEPVPIPPDHRPVSPLELVRRLRHGHDARLLLYMLCVQITVQIAHGFFNPFVLSQLHFSYGAYVALVAAPFLARMMSLPLFGRIAHTYGPHRLVWLGGLGIVPLSALWMVSDSFVWLLGAQLIAGALWAAYELSTFLLLIETIPQHERTSIVAQFNAANAAAMVAGGLIGASLLRFLGTDHAAYMVIFGVSVAARLATVFLLARLCPVKR